jgi:CheY-like chemotaxis protein
MTSATSTPNHNSAQTTQADQITWTRDALEHLYDLAFLQRSILQSHRNPAFQNAQELQGLLLRLIQQIKPTPEVPASSLAWRVYNTLDLRYVRALTQNEAASELNISLRQLRREQDRGIEAVATLLFVSSAPTKLNLASPTMLAPELSSEQAARAATPGGANPSSYEYLRLDDLLHAVLSLIDPLLSQHNINVRVTLPHPTPILNTNRIIIRQLLIMVISWVIHDQRDDDLSLTGDVREGHVYLLLSRPCRAEGVLLPLPAEERTTLEQLTREAGAEMQLLHIDPPQVQVSLTLPISDQQQVLMIDDSADSIELARRYLQQTPYDLIAVTRPEEGLQQAQVLQPSCIVLDVMMPGRDGWEILALLKSHPDTLHIPVIVCSVLRNQDLAIALGAACILPRPHSAAQLLDALQSVTSSRNSAPTLRPGH